MPTRCSAAMRSGSRVGCHSIPNAPSCCRVPVAAATRATAASRPRVSSRYTTRAPTCPPPSCGVARPPVSPLPRTSAHALPDQRDRAGSAGATGLAASPPGGSACSIGDGTRAAAWTVPAIGNDAVSRAAVTRSGGVASHTRGVIVGRGATPPCAIRRTSPRRTSGTRGEAGLDVATAPVPTGRPTRAVTVRSAIGSSNSSAIRAPVQPPTTIIRNRSGRPSPPNPRATTPRFTGAAAVTRRSAARRGSGARSCPSAVRAPRASRRSAPPRAWRRAAR